MKRWKLILALILAAAVVVAIPLGVMAQTPTTPGAVTLPVVKGNLVIVAPRAVLSGKEMQLTVFQRNDQATVGDAQVWAVGKDKIEALRQAIQAQMKDTAVKPADKDYAATIGIYATLIGRTDANGVLKHSFADAGNYWLVTFKKTYRPGFSPLLVRNAPVGLAISGPKSAKPNEPVTFTVKQKGSEAAVEGAGVWAIPAPRLAALKNAMGRIAAAIRNKAGATNFATILGSRAISLGATDANGQIKDYRFAKAGRYILVTWKAGFTPGFGTIGIAAPAASTTQ